MDDNTARIVGQAISLGVPILAELIRAAVAGLTGEDDSTPEKPSPKRERVPDLLMQAIRVRARLESAPGDNDTKRASALRVLCDWNKERGSPYAMRDLELALMLAVQDARRPI